MKLAIIEPEDYQDHDGCIDKARLVFILDGFKVCDN